ncbi:MAG TPA: universal stress protein [Bacteroidia bacterium]|nr:universal stress protein [Bacteroidia bacterium]
MKTILVPTDYSKNALNAMKYAFAYAEATNSKIILFHAYEEPTTELDMPFFGGAHYGKKEAKENAEKDMRKLVNKLAKTFITTKPTYVVQPGIASDNILAYAEQNKISKIIMGTNGEHALIKTLFGSTASSIITNATCNVIAVPPKAKFKGIDKVVIGVDLENENFLATCEAVAFAKQFGAEITFIHVQDLELFDSETALEELAGKLEKQMKYKKISFYISREADIIDGLSDYIKKKKPDMLLMINYGRKFPETIWEPSWTNKMSNHLQVPLFVLHANQNENAKKSVKQAEEAIKN